MSFTQQGGTKDAPDYIYYNADIINNETDDRGNNGQSIVDPVIRFQETRDTALVKNCADYYFSIVRFSMNGPPKDLPLWMPNIQSGTGQINPNLTEYGMAVGMTMGIYGGAGSANIINIQATPAIRYMLWSPENKNTTGAPVPPGTQNPKFKGEYSSSTQYYLGDIVTTQNLTNATLYPFNVAYQSYAGGFFQVASQPSWVSQNIYQAGAVVLFNGQLYYVKSGQTSVAGQPPVNSTTIWGVGIPVGTPTTSAYWQSITEDNGVNQNISTLYYYGQTYAHFSDLWNLTMYNPADLSQQASSGTRASTCCLCDTYFAMYDATIAGGFTWNSNWNTFQNWLKSSSSGIWFVPPKLSYNPLTELFTLTADSDFFGDRIQQNVVSVSGTAGVQATNGFARLFFNTNMNGLLGNLDTTYFNSLTPGVLGTGVGNNLANVAFTGAQTTSGAGGSVYTYLASGQSLVGGLVPVPNGYSYEVGFVNRAYQNVVDYTNSTYVPNGIVNSAQMPISWTKPFWLATQDFPSVNMLWSPISSIVFTSTLLPVKNEAVGQPIVLGTGNLGQSRATSASAFQPIITDISIDQSQSGASAYKEFIYYAPQAEYRLSDFSAHNQDIRTIDIQVFWKHRLTGDLIPIQMYNLSSVSIKCMFRRKTVSSKTETSIPH